LELESMQTPVAAAGGRDTEDAAVTTVGTSAVVFGDVETAGVTGFEDLSTADEFLLLLTVLRRPFLDLM
jgi:hypothetical protein